MTAETSMTLAVRTFILQCGIDSRIFSFLLARLNIHRSAQ